jgi:hypothetical protein
MNPLIASLASGFVLFTRSSVRPPVLAREPWSQRNWGFVSNYCVCFRPHSSLQLNSEAKPQDAGMHQNCSEKDHLANAGSSPQICHKLVSASICNSR